jgi:site-specific recombinase XerD
MPTCDYERQATRTLDHIISSPVVNQGNKDLVEAYHRQLLFSGASAAHRQKLLSRLKILVEYIGETPIRELDREDIEELVAWLYTRGTTEATASEYKQVIKQFWKWMHDGEEPPETKWIRRGPRSQRRLLPRSLLTPFDVAAMIRSCTNERDRAFVAMLWETGARIGELIDLRVGDIEDGTLGQYVVVSGKTGARRLLLLEAGPYITEWITVHPRPTSDAYLWCKIDPLQGTPDE